MASSHASSVLRGSRRRVGPGVVVLKSLSVLRVGIEDFKSGLSKFVAMFTDTFGLRLAFRGTSCYTDGKLVVIPELGLLARPNMTEDEVREAQDFLMTTRGFVYHEGAHVILSDFAAAGLAHKEGGSKLHTLTNMLEDIRIEHKIGKLYPGAKEALEFTRTWVNVRIVRRIEEEAPSEFVQAIYAIACVGNGGKYEDEDLWKSLSPAAQSLATRHASKIIEAKHANNTTEVLVIARKIFDELKDEEEAHRAKKATAHTTRSGKPASSRVGRKMRKETTAEEANEGDTSPGGSSSGDNEETESSSSTPTEDASSSRLGSSPSASEADDEDDEMEDTEGAGEEDEEDDSSVDDEADGPSRMESEEDDVAGRRHGSSASATYGGGASSPAEKHDETEDDYEDEYADLDLEHDVTADEKYTRYEDTITEAAKEAGAAMLTSGKPSYLVYSTETDYVGPPPEPVNAEAAQKLRKYTNDLTDEVRFAYGPVERTLRAILQAQTHAYHVGGLEDGELDPNALDKLAMRLPGHERVFRQHVVSSALTDTACTISIDISGSMGVQARDVLAQKAALCFAHALESVKIPFEILAWSTQNSYRGESRFNGLTEDEQKLYTRYGSLFMYVIKSYQEKWTQVNHRLYHIKARENNYDGESVLLSARRLMQRKEKRKVLFVLSDGLPGPDCNESPRKFSEHLHDVVNEIRNTTPIELIGIGINSAPSGQFYRPNFVNVPNVHELPTVVVQQLKKFLLKGNSK